MGKKSLGFRVLATLAALGVIAAMCVTVGSAPLSRAENEDWREVSRARNRKVYQLYERDEPTSLFRHEYSIGDMHYWDGSSWQDPVWEATTSDQEVRFDKLPVAVAFSNGGTISYNYSVEDAMLTIWPKVGNVSATPRFADSEVRYASLWSGVSIDLRPTGSGTKAVLLLDEPGHPVSFDFVLSSNLRVAQNGNRVELLDDVGKAIFLIRPPFIALDEDNWRAGEIQLQDNVVTLTLPDLTGLSYPLEVDPTIQVGASTDDVHETKTNGGSLYHDWNSHIRMGEPSGDTGYNTWAGMRFTNVTVPQGADITSAKLQFRACCDDSSSVSFTIYAHDSDDSATFSDATGESGRPGARTTTTASAAWSPGSWSANTWYDSVDISSVIEEVVTRAGWSSGSDLSALIDTTATTLGNMRRANSYDESSSYAPKLVVTYVESVNHASWSVTASNNDAHEESNGTAPNNSTNGVWGNYNGTYVPWQGARFTNVTIPPGSKIFTATHKVYINHEDTGPTTAYAYAEDTDSAAAFSGSSYDLSSRTTTSARTTFDPSQYTQDTWEGTDVTSPVQEVIDRNGWASGNALAILVNTPSDPGTGVRVGVRHYDYGSSTAYSPQLDVYYDKSPDPPTSLQCEGSTNPGDVLDTSPEFSAIGTDGDDGDTLTHAYIQVGTTVGGSDMWDSGWQDITDFTEGNRCATITYSGNTLSAGTKYYWRIKFKDDDNAEGQWSTESAWFVMSGAPDVPTSLLCEGVSSPSDVTDTTPEFSAIVTDPNDGDTITHAEVEVGTTAGGNDMWDSGWQDIADFTEGNRCADISYAGSTLSPETTYYWRIRFKDNDNKEGGYSNNAQFTTEAAFYLSPTSRSVTASNTYTFDVKAAHQTSFDSYDFIVGSDPDVATVDDLADAGWLNSASDGGESIDNDGGVAKYGAYSTGTDVSGSGTLATFTVTAQATDTFTPGLLAASVSMGTTANDMVWCRDDFTWDNSDASGGDSYADCDGVVNTADIDRVAARWNYDCTGGTYPNCTGCDAEYDIHADYTGDCDITVVDIMQVVAKWGETSPEFDLHVSDLVETTGGKDDAEQAGTSVANDYDNTTVTVGGATPYFAGWIFRNVPLDYGDVVTAAYLVLDVASKTGDVTLELFTEDKVNHEFYGDNVVQDFSNDKISQRIVDKYPGTGGYCDSVSRAADDYCGLWVEWTIDSMGVVTSPNLALIIQEAVGRADWHNSDSITILARPAPTETHSATINAFEHATADPAKLGLGYVENNPFRYIDQDKVVLGGGGGSTWAEWDNVRAYHWDTSISWNVLATAEISTANDYNYSYLDGYANQTANLAADPDWITVSDGVTMTHLNVRMVYSYPTWMTGWDEMLEEHIDELDEMYTALAMRYDGDGDFNNDDDVTDCFASGYDEPDATGCAGQTSFSWDASEAAPAIRYWGLFNEPDSVPSVATGTAMAWKDDVTDGDAFKDFLEYVRGLATMFLAVKRVSPANNVLYGGLSYDNNSETDSSDFLTDTLRYGAMSFCDTIDYHYYPLGWESLSDKLDEDCASGCSPEMKGIRDVIEEDGIDIDGYEGYSTSGRKKYYALTEEGANQAKSSSTQTEQAHRVFENAAAAAGESYVDFISWFTYVDRTDLCHGLKANNIATCYPDGSTAERPSYYAFWSFTHNLSDTVTVSEMTTGATPGSYDLPTGYEGYLFKTDTITRAVVWNNTGTSNLEIKHSSGGSGYVRIARSTKIVDTERGTVDSDYGGIGWAQCKDDDACYVEDGSGNSIWSTDWDDQTIPDDYYTIHKDRLSEPIMIWSDTNDIEITW